jgi:hypothetical protein
MVMTLTAYACQESSQAQLWTRMTPQSHFAETALYHDSVAAQCWHSQFLAHQDFEHIPTRACYSLDLVFLKGPSVKGLVPAMVLMGSLKRPLN